LVLSFGSGSIISIKVCLYSYVLQSFCNQAVLVKQRIEGIDMWGNSRFEGWVCCMILGRVSEKVLSS